MSYKGKEILSLQACIGNPEFWGRLMNAFSSDRPALLIIDMVKDDLDEKNLCPLKASTSKLWTSTAKTFSIRFSGF
jgi:hypothetical protein